MIESIRSRYIASWRSVSWQGYIRHRQGLIKKCLDKTKLFVIVVLAVPVSLPVWSAAPPGSMIAPLTLLLFGDDACSNVTVSLVTDNNSLVVSDPTLLTNVDGTLFFSTHRNSPGVELWKSDGTPGGTMVVKDINPGTGHSSPNHLTDVNGTLYFTAVDGSNGRELWKSDGTFGGTVLVKDVNADPSGSTIANLTNVNGTLYFTANDGTHGNELWKSDGTSGGTVMVKDIRSGTTFGNGPALLTDVNGTLFFHADDGSTGQALWKSDGTTSGTVPVKGSIRCICPNSDESDRC